MDKIEERKEKEHRHTHTQHTSRKKKERIIIRSDLSCDKRHTRPPYPSIEICFGFSLAQNKLIASEKDEQTKYKIRFMRFSVLCSMSSRLVYFLCVFLLV